MNKTAAIILLSVIIMAIPELALAGEFYQLTPTWFGYVYYLLSMALIAACFYTSYLVYSTMKGGKLGLPWILFLISFGTLLLRTALGFLTFIDVGYFKAVVFAVLDLIFIVALMIGLLLYKENLN
ncbi:MAG: hypothetical protein GX409_00470 [candidate division Zixibacteria bacterium]|jgi:hypothetical protein|nr:hypothetical protein [candidate division Zixibacteria bacterium]